MTEKKLHVELQLERAQETIKEKDARIAELEAMVKRLTIERTQMAQSIAAA